MFKTFSKKIYDKIYAVRENGKPFLKYFSVNDYKGLLTDDFSIKSMTTKLLMESIFIRKIIEKIV